MQTRRLLKLAQHLESGKLGHKKFDFTTINDDEPNKCGSAGCALGEMPIVWPKLLKFSDWSGVTFIDEPRYGRATYETAESFFGMDSEDIANLFSPGYIHKEWGRKLGDRATAVQVAANIRAFVAWKQGQTRTTPRKPAPKSKRVAR